MDTEQIIQRLEALEKWKAEKTQQQISFPLDQFSKDVLQRDFIQVVGFGKTSGASGNEFLFYTTKIDGNLDQIMSVAYGMFPVNVDYTTDYFTANFEVPDGTALFVTAQSLDRTSSPFVPGGLLDGVTYYVVNSSGTKFKLSSTFGGSAINITSNGGGNIFMFKAT